MRAPTELQCCERSVALYATPSYSHGTAFKKCRSLLICVLDSSWCFLRLSVLGPGGLLGCVTAFVLADPFECRT